MARDRSNEPWQGSELGGDYVNLQYALACKAGKYDYRPDCGHNNCGLLCDVLIRRVRSRRAEAATQGHPGRAVAVR